VVSGGIWLHRLLRSMGLRRVTACLQMRSLSSVGNFWNAERSDSGGDALLFVGLSFSDRLESIAADAGQNSYSLS
jgi:hypothetical protein